VALPTIVFNPDTGSDALRSGAGPGDGTTSGSAVTQTDTIYTDGPSTDLKFVGIMPDLSNVLTDGSHVLNIATPTGRKFTRILGIDDTDPEDIILTVEDEFDIDVSTPRSWGIGGKRRTFDDVNQSRNLFIDAHDGWTIRSEGGFAQNITTVVACQGGSAFGVGPMIRVVAAVPGTVLSTNHNGQLFQVTSGVWEWEGWDFRSTNATRTGCWLESVTALCLRDCILGHATDKLTRGVFANGLVTLINCEVQYTTEDGISTSSGFNLRMINCSVHHCTSQGLFIAQTANNSIEIVNCQFYANEDIGIELDVKYNNTTIKNCTIHGNGGDGIYLSDTISSNGMVFINNIISGNGGVGVKGLTDLAPLLINANNAYYDNTGGHREDFPVGTDDIEDVNPGFVDADAGDFTPAATMANLGWPLEESFTNPSYPTLGSIQLESGGGGGGGGGMAMKGLSGLSGLT
jgi:parallel beta-helix repeat protein